MKFTTERADLTRALAGLARIVERRQTIPILTNVRLTADRAGGVTIRATDLDILASDRIRADVAEPGDITVPAGILTDLVRKLPDGAQVRMELAGDGGHVTVASGRSRFKLNALPATDFPEMEAGETTHAFIIDPSELRTLLDRTSFAISTEETRYYLNGVFLHAPEHEGATVLRAVATDGHRLARVDVPAPAGAAGMPGIIVPRKAVGEFLKLAEEHADAPIHVNLSQAKVRMAVGSRVIVSKLIDGTFPDYQRVIPTGNDKRLLVPTAELRAGLERVACIATERGRAVKLTVAAGRVGLTVVSPDSGTASDELEAEYEADAIEIGFNARYLLDVLAQTGGKRTLVRLAEAGSPTLFQPETGDAALFVLMPMRVG